MNNQILIDRINNTLLTANKSINSAITRRDEFLRGEFHKSIIDATLFLDPSAPLAERIYCILNGINENQKCQCGAPLTWKGYKNKPYTRSCSSNICKRKTNSQWKSSSKSKCKKEAEKKQNFYNFLQLKYEPISHDKLTEFCTKRLELNTPFNTSLMRSHPEYLRTLLDISYLDYTPNLKWSQLFYNYINRITEQPRCCKCNAALNFRNSIFGYSTCMHRSCLQDTVAISRKANHNRVVKDFLLENGYELLTNHGLNEAKHDIKHLTCGHVFSKHIAGGSWQTKVLCPFCFPSTSIFQNEIFQFISEELNTPCISNDRNIIQPQELDIFIPQNNVAIECNGVYWHTEGNGKDRQYHLNKYQKCKSKNIQLLQVWESEWRDKQDIVKSIISSKIGKVKKIYARKCKISIINNRHLKHDFLNSNHLQGRDNSQLAYGLFYNGTLVSMMTFGHRKITKGNYKDWEMIRFCNKINYTIVGGASKLLSHFIKDNKPEQILTYADLRFSKGSLYDQLGFKLKHFSKPGYWYLIGDQLKHRSGFMKHRLKNILKTFDENLTEYENMKNNGYDRVWDCGHAVYHWNSPK